MKTYNIQVFVEADKDFDEMVDYLAGFSKETALKYYDLVMKKIEALTTMPERCPLAKETQFRLRGYRTMFINDYTVFYVINGTTVEIHRILYSKRQFEGLL